jgi:dTDP-4-amino-4,6-dideoxygalactose transaminase
MCRLLTVHAGLREHVAVDQLYTDAHRRRPFMNDAVAAALAKMPDPGLATHVHELETRLAEQFGTAFAIAVNSGTAALHTALLAVGVGPGDSVLMPALSVVMPAVAVIHAGARPVFVDCNEGGTDFDYTDLAAKVTRRARAVMPVHMWGRIGNPIRLTEFARHHQLKVVEDACQAQGSQTHDRMAGTFGNAGCFSMKDGKVLWSGEGGFILTNDRHLAEYCRAYRSHWLTPPTGHAPQSRIGHNYRLAEPLAALAVFNLGRFPQLLQQRINQTATLYQAVQAAGLVPPSAASGWNGYSSLWNVDLPRPRDFCQRLAQAGVPNSVGTFGLTACHQRPLFESLRPNNCPNAAHITDRTLAVVLTERDDEHQLSRYADIINQEARSWPNV